VHAWHYVLAFIGIEHKSNDDTKVMCPQNTIKEKFLVDMPQDFYDFWEFCKDLNPTAPEGIVLLTIFTI